jgi:hypothetical protein
MVFEFSEQIASKSREMLCLTLAGEPVSRMLAKRRESQSCPNPAAPGSLPAPWPFWLKVNVLASARASLFCRGSIPPESSFDGF